MKKSVLAAAAAALLSVMAPLPAEAQYRMHGIHNNWDGPRNLGYANRWNGNRYYNRYRPYYGGFGVGLGTGILGFALGSALANSYDNRVYVDSGYGGGWSNHVARCEARYRSYDARSDTFLGYDGDYHRCRL